MIVVTLLSALVVWLLSLFPLHLATSNPLISLVFSIVGAFVIASIFKKIGFISSRKGYFFTGLVGGFVVVLLLSLRTTGTVKIVIDCNPQPPILVPLTVDPDTAGVDLDWDVYWEGKNDHDFKIDFKESNPGKTPFRHWLIFYNKHVESKGGKTNGNKAVAKGEFYYGVTCTESGHHVDPMIKVPPNFVEKWLGW